MRKEKLVFTVIDSDNITKPIVWAQSAPSKDENVQENAMDLIAGWCKANNVDITEHEIEDIAYEMCHDGCAWHLERYCFELTELNA